MTKILAFAGSTRRDSLNKKLVRIAADRACEAGGEVTLIDLRDFLFTTATSKKLTCRPKAPPSFTNS